MPLNISVFPGLMLRQGAMPAAATLSPAAAAQVVALGAASSALSGPALLCLIPDEDQRIGVSANSGYSAPSASGIKLKAGVERWFEVGTAPIYISAIAG